jgi:1,4-alpha-glucan branching enzyme
MWPANARLLPERTAGEEFHVVQLRVFKDGARKVCVAGTFNDWNPQRAPLQRNADGEWVIALSLAPGEYEYRFVADD